MFVILLSLTACDVTSSVDDSVLSGEFVFEDHWWQVRSSDEIPDETASCSSSADLSCRECIYLGDDGLHRYAEAERQDPDSGQVVDVVEEDLLLAGSWTLAQAAADGYDDAETGRIAQVYDVGGVEVEVVTGAHDVWDTFDGDRSVSWGGKSLVVTAGCNLAGAPDVP